MQGFYDDCRAGLLTDPYWIHLNLCTNNCDFCRKKNLVAEMLNTVLKCNHAQEFEAGFDPSEKWTACIENNKYQLHPKKLQNKYLQKSQSDTNELGW